MRGRTGTPRRAAAFQTAAKAASPSAPPLSQLSRSLSAAQVQLSSAAQRRSWRALFRLDAHCTRPSWCLRRPRSSLLRPRRLFPRAMPPCMLPSPSLPRMLGTAASAMAPSRGGPRTSLAALLSSPFRWPCLRFWTLAGLTPRARRLLRSGSASSTAHPRALAWSGGSSLILVAPRRPWPLSARHPQSALSRCLRSLCPRPCPAPWPSAMLPWLLQQGGRPSASSERHARLRSRMNVGRAAGARCLGEPEQHRSAPRGCPHPAAVLRVDKAVYAAACVLVRRDEAEHSAPCSPQQGPLSQASLRRHHTQQQPLRKESVGRALLRLYAAAA
jgi:hypothetical protein